MFPDAFLTTRLLLRPIAPSAPRRPSPSNRCGPLCQERPDEWRCYKRIDQTRAYIEACIAASSARTYVLVPRGSEKPIGALDLRRSTPWRFGFGYCLARSAWGRGLMTEALTEVADWSLRQDGVWRIGDVCDVDNAASARVMEKAGFAREGILKRWTIHPNVSKEPRDCISFGRVRLDG